MTMPSAPYAPSAPSSPSWVGLLTPTQCPCCGQAVMPTPQDYLDAFSSSMDAFTSSMSQWMGTAGGTAPMGSSMGAGPGSRPAGTAGAGMPWYGWGRQQTAGGRHGHSHKHGHGHGHAHDAGCGCGCHDHGHHDHDHGHHDHGHGQGHRHGHESGCGCCGGHGGCRADDCHCQCCIGDDIDLVVYSRVGERRVVPITIANERRREREVTLELSGFTTKGGRPLPVTVVGAIIGASTFTLAPCEERAVTIEVASEAAQSEREQPTDVDDCLVAVADLRVSGCDIRCPIGIGLVLLPRDCDAYHLSCGCGCC
jgi:hypothetical protein